MAWLRTKQYLVMWLVGLFMVGQLAGVVPRPVSSPSALVTALAAETHEHGHSDVAQTQGHDHQDGHQHNAGVVDSCCALHLLAGVIPPVVNSEARPASGARVVDDSNRGQVSHLRDRLDRPPRSLLS